MEGAKSLAEIAAESAPKAARSAHEEKALAEMKKRMEHSKRGADALKGTDLSEADLDEYMRKKVREDDPMAHI